MDWFARRGFDVWCVDMEGYGRSSQDGDNNAPISQGADDCLAAAKYIQSLRGNKPLLVYAVHKQRLVAAQRLDVFRGSQAIVGALQIGALLSRSGRTAIAFHVDTPHVEAAAHEPDHAGRDLAAWHIEIEHQPSHHRRAMNEQDRAGRLRLAGHALIPEREPHVRP